MDKRAYWLLFVLLAHGSPCLADINQPSSYAVETVEFISSNSPTPPSDREAWRQRTLPDNWSESQPGKGGIGWYRVQFSDQIAQGEILGVHLTRIRMNADIWVNNERIRQGARFEEPVSRYSNRPIYATAPSGILKNGSNTLHVRIFAYPNVSGGLYGLEIGPDSVLRPAYESRFFRQVTLNEAAFVITLLMAVMLGLLWLRRPQDTVYGWFALTSLLWTANATHFFIRDMPVSTWLWEWTIQAGTDWFGVLLAILVHRYFGIKKPIFEGLLVIYALIATIWLASSELREMATVTKFVHPVALLILVYLSAISLVATWRSRRLDDALITVTVSLHLVLGIHDLILKAGIFSHADHWYLMHYASPIFFAAMTWVLVNRFIKAMSAYEQSVSERESIMRDLHDGLGAQLVNSLALAEADPNRNPLLQDSLRDALHELRLVIDSLDVDSGDLSLLLATFRERYEPQLKRQGMAFEWRVGNLQTRNKLDTNASLQTIRILQEAITNIIKHARARTITVQTKTELDAKLNERIYLAITDDGIGIENMNANGHGLKNMHARAASINAILDITSRGRGTTVSLQVPC